MKRPIVLLFLLCCAFGLLIGPFSARMKNRPLVEKLGYLPNPTLLRMVSADQKPLAAASLVFKTMMYYGGLPDEGDARRRFSPDFGGMGQTLQTVSRLDPYNMDAYYFGQATLVWDLQHFSEANALLDFGMRYRDWDFYLPLFAGFNSAYFLRDFESAARYYRRVADLTGSDYFMKLSGRYLYEIGATEQAIAYLTMMVKTANNEAVRQGLETRLKAFQSVREIEVARDQYQRVAGRLPKDLEELQRSGFLLTLPIDPYGGSFYLDAGGRVLSTSNFIPIIVEKEKNQ